MSDVNPDIRAIFCEALERKSTEELAQYLDVTCGSDADLRAQLEELLAAHGKAGNFLGGPSLSRSVTINMPVEPPVAATPGTVIGPYKLLQQIGEGGMGVVYMAEQAAPVRRKVALKIIKPGMDILGSWHDMSHRRERLR